MILFLYGPDTYRSRQKLNEIIDSYKKTHQSGLNLRYFDFEVSNYQDLKDEFQITPMFAEKKLIICQNTSINQDFRDKFLKDIKKFTDSKDIILFYEEKTPESSFLKEVKKHGKCQEFQFLEEGQLKNWLKKEFQKYNIEVNSKIIQDLIDFVGNDTWQLSNEIQKLATFKKGEGKIEEKDISLLVRPKIETDIFKMIDAIALKNKKQALSLLHKHLEKGEPALYLLSMINFQFRNLLEIKDLIEKNIPYYLILKKSHLHPFVIKKNYQQADRFSFPELKKIYQKIFQADLGIKTGKIEPETALDVLIAET